MKVFTLEKENGSFVRQEREIPENDTLESMKEIIGCRFVQVMSFTFKGVEYDVWYDDEFLLQERPVGTLILGNLRKDEFVVLCGNLFFARHDEEGNTVGLTKRDISNLWEFTDINGVRLMIAFRQGLIKSA